jgi:hypothetical protein
VLANRYDESISWDPFSNKEGKLQKRQLTL